MRSPPPKGATTTDPRRRWLASRVRRKSGAAAGRRRRCLSSPLSRPLSPFLFFKKNSFQLSDAFSLPLAEATAAVERHSAAVDAFFDGKASNESGENQQDSESLSWFYQPRATAATATATAELFLSDPSVNRLSLCYSSYASLLPSIGFSYASLFPLSL